MDDRVCVPSLPQKHVSVFVNATMQKSFVMIDFKNVKSFIEKNKV